MKKGLRQQILSSVMEANSDNLIGLSDILSGNERPEDIMVKVENYLDDNCANGYFSRWTGHGNSIYDDAVKLVSRLEDKYASMNL